MIIEGFLYPISKYRIAVDSNGGTKKYKWFGQRHLNAEAEAQSSLRLNRCLAKLKARWDAETKWQMPARFC